MKTIYIILGLLLIIAGSFYFLRDTNTENLPIDQETETSSLAAYMQEQMFTRATADGLIPIEGYDADLLMGAFPGLTVSDFERVETFEGHYEIQNDELVFIRDQEQPISTAERTVSTEGYGTLLGNLSARLDMPADTEEAIDALIDVISQDN